MLAAVGSIVLWMLNRVRVNAVLGAIYSVPYPISIWITSLVWIGVGVLIIIAARRHLAVVATTGLILVVALSLFPTLVSLSELANARVGVSVDTMMILMLITLLLCGSMVALLPIASTVRRGHSIAATKTAAIVMLSSYLVIMVVRHIDYSIRGNYDLVQQISILPIFIFIVGWIILAAGASSRTS